jgi:hypothetical protein
MTARQFMRQVESYYGKYRPVVWDVVAEYIEELKPESRVILFSRLVKKFSAQYKFVPDLAAIREVWRGYQEERYYKEQEDGLPRIEGPVPAESDLEDMREEIKRLQIHLAHRPKTGLIRRKRSVDRMREIERIKTMAAFEELKNSDFKRRILAARTLIGETAQQRYERIAGELEREKQRWENGE